MEMENAQDQAPAEQVVEAPKADNTNQIDYKSFFESAIEKEMSRIGQINEALATKLTDAQKFALEKEAFEIEKKLHELGVKQPTQESVIEGIVGLGLKPGDGQYEFLKGAIDGLSIQEARPVIEAFSEFIKAGRTTTTPADLTGSPVGTGERGTGIGISAKDMIGKDSRAAKANLVDLMSALANKGM